MWSQTVKIKWHEMQFEVELLLEERDLRYGEDTDGNRAQNQSSIKIIEINTITDTNEKIYNWDDFEFSFIDSLEQHDEVMNILEEIINRGELC